MAMLPRQLILEMSLKPKPEGLIFWAISALARQLPPAMGKFVLTASVAPPGKNVPLSATVFSVF
jgi:hypothetical protein